MDLSHEVGGVPEPSARVEPDGPMGSRQQRPPVSSRTRETMLNGGPKLDSRVRKYYLRRRISPKLESWNYAEVVEEEGVLIGNLFNCF